MSAAPKRRPKRIPFTPEEVANIIEIKKRRELMRLAAFQKTYAYKFQNVFNVVCFFVYWELVFCFFGPLNYQKHYSVAFEPRYGNAFENGKLLMNELDVHGANNVVYTYLVNDFIDSPPRYSSFDIGSDYILKKQLRGRLSHSDATYRLFSSSPVLLIVFIVLVTSCTAYYFNLNQNAHSLMALTVLNSLSMLILLTI